MKETAKAEQKLRNNRSSGLHEALKRRDMKITRFFYKSAIQSEQKHLKECNQTNCIKCKDAKVLIPYYQSEMKKDLRNIDREFDKIVI